MKLFHLWLVFNLSMFYLLWISLITSIFVLKHFHGGGFDCYLIIFKFYTVDLSFKRRLSNCWPWIGVSTHSRQIVGRRFKFQLMFRQIVDRRFKYQLMIVKLLIVDSNLNSCSVKLLVVDWSVNSCSPNCWSWIGVSTLNRQIVCVGNVFLWFYLCCGLL